MEPVSWQEDVLQRVESQIAEHGHTVIGTATDDGIGLSYTVGRTNSGHAELVGSVPVEPQVLLRILNMVADWEDETGSDVRTTPGPVEGIIHLPLRFAVAEQKLVPANVLRVMFPEHDLVQVLF